MVCPLGYVLQFHVMTIRRGAAPTQASHPPGPGFIPPNGGPVFPEPQVARSTTTTRRAQTPFMRPSMDHDDDDVRRTQGRATPHPQPGLGIRIQESTTGRSRHGHHTQTPGQPPSRQLYDRYRRDSEESLRDANIARVLEPLEPAEPGVFGPSHGRARAPLSNPLPPPPRDIYEMSPYKALLNLPHTTELLANYGQTEPQLQPHFQSTKETKKPKKGGLFRAFSRRSEENKEKEPKVLYVPIVMPANNPTAGGSTGRLPAMPPLGGPNPSDTLARSFSVSNPPIPRPPSPAGSHVRDPPIRFNQDTEHAGFLNHSPYRVIYENHVYPTATHLLEALKFMPHRMDIVTQIRACADVADVYPLSATLQQHARKDWAQVHLEQVRCSTSWYAVYCGLLIHRNSDRWLKCCT